MGADGHDRVTTLIGKQLGDYTLVGVLATGGMARIYEGVDRRLGRQVAVKVLEVSPEALAEDELLPTRFQREARAVAQLEHDNIITIYQYGEQDGVYFIAMKLVRGRDLAQELARLRRSGMRMEVQRGLRILEQVAAALDWAHQAQIVHRDVKPSNILLDSSDRATLTDFGLVMQTSFDSTLGTAFGTPRYIAPEQALSSGNAVAQSDVYSLAVILYEILTGQTPFDGSTAMEIALSQINDPPPPPRGINPSIPDTAERAILRALDKDPTKRPPTAGELIAEVKRAYDPDSGVGGGSPTALAVKTTLLPEMPTSPAPPAQRSRLPLLGVLVAAVALIALAGYALISAGRSSPPDATSPTQANSALAAVTDAPIPSANLLLSYSDTTFSVINVGAGALDVSGLAFDQGSVTFAGSSIPRGSLPAGSCFRIQLERVQSALPSQCARLDGASVLPDTGRFFWLSDADGGSFEVRENGSVIATCATVRRGGSASCPATLTPAA